MKPVAQLIVILAVAIIAGVASAWLAIERGQIFGAISAGNWTAWPTTGSADADPYSMAMLARTGQVPLGAGEGIAFTAESDGEGEPLTGTCVYQVAGQTPAARLWTLTAYEEAGRLMSNAARRTGFHSREVLRAEDGSFLITVSSEVAPGNWLPIAPTAGHVTLVLRLYDTPLTTGSQIGSLVMPAIHKAGCR